ncbi:MAG TPA: FAD-dependent oxidoreductase [Pirellulales bacterium]|jgi:hydrogen cyanide synthase HcnC|nr:FAD-dependent oxidoreductase [Pirellulales bacterium]
MSNSPEVIVVGGGVIGCAVTYELARRSVPTLLVDQSLPGRATSASAGGLWPVGEAVGLGCGVIYHAAHSGTTEAANGDGNDPLPLSDAFRDFLVRSNARFPDLAVELQSLAQLDIEYAPGAGLLFVIEGQSQWTFVERVRRSLSGSVRLEMLSPDEVARLEPQLRRDILGGVLLSGEHQVNPMLLAEAYKRAAIRLGAAFRPHVSVQAIRRRGNRVVGVETTGEFLPCSAVVNAAGAWAGRLAATAGLELPVFPVRGQIVLTDTLPRVLNSCLSTSTCYLLQKAHGEVLIGSTTEHCGFDVSVTPEAIAALCQGAAQTVPTLRKVGIKRVWAGLRPGTPDELPILGPQGGLDGYFNAAGGFRTGIVASPLTGEVVAQCVASEAASVDCAAFSGDRFESTADTKLNPIAAQ